jgi:putative DNA primase/helicase
LGDRDSTDKNYIKTGVRIKKSEEREDTEPGRLASFIIDQIPKDFDIYDGYDLNERHIARAVVDCCGRWIRFCPEVGWMVYHAEDGCWKETYAESVVQRVIGHFAELVFEGVQAAAEYRCAKHLLSAAGIHAVQSLVKHDPRVITAQEKFDENGDLLNCKGDLYNLRTGAVRPAEPEDLLTRSVFCKAKAGEKDKKTGMPLLPPAFKDFITKITSKDGVERPDLALFILFFFGYSLTGDTGAAFFVNFHGTGKNGKGTLLTLMLKLFGDYAATLPKDVVIENRFQSQFDLAGLPGIRLGVLTDAPEGRLNMDTLKPLLTGDPQNAKRKFLKDFSFKPVLKIAVGSNPRLTLKETGFAVKRRIRMVPFDYTVSDEEEVNNLELEKRLLEEAPEILALLIFFAREYYRGRGGPRAFPACAVVDEASREYMESEDLVGRYVEERIEKAEGHEEKADDLYQDFGKWEDTQRIRKKMSRNKFGDRLSVILPDKKRKNSGIFYLGVRIKGGGDGG